MVVLAVFVLAKSRRLVNNTIMVIMARRVPTKVHSDELRNGTCSFCTRYTSINNVYINLKDQMKLDTCICEALSYLHGTMETVFVGVAINYHQYQLC